MKRAAPLSALALAAAAIPATARAGGYDTPMLYSARHIGMGGAAVGYVSDPSALFHNPAGLAHTGRFSATADFSALFPKVKASPGLGAQDVESERTLAPLFLLGAAYRLTDWLTAGVGVYPNASAGAKYRYDLGGSTTENETQLVFIEGSPALAVDLPGRLRLGAGYRVTYVDVQRFQGVRGAPVAGLDFEMSGFDTTGWRLGAQWTPVDWLQVGAAYRHKTETRVSNDAGTAVALRFSDIETTFLLPSKLSLGARADRGPFGVAIDGEYLWNSQNDAFPLLGTPPVTEQNPNPTRQAVPNVFDWKDAVTVRGGVEYRLLTDPADGMRRLALRAGYVFDGATTSARFPSAFGTPPGPTHVLTAGAGWRFRRFEVNAAYGYRFGSGEVRPEDIAARDRPCAFCGVAGQEPYGISLHALYLDVGFALD